jgi:hypothetical protein
MLAYWLPILPFVIWVGQVLGWMISVMELLIATPVWMAAHLHPEGEGVSGQHAASGYKVVLELLLRPTLLVFGLIVTMLILTPFMQFFSTSFFNAFSTTTADSVTGLVAFFVMIFIYGAMCWMVINMVLNAITIVPNGIMRVIGGMEGTNAHLGKEMSSGVKAGMMMGVNKTVDAAMGLKRQGMYNPERPGAPGATTETAATDTTGDKPGKKR